MYVSLLTKIMLVLVTIWLVACTIFAKYLLSNSHGGSGTRNGSVNSLWDEFVGSHTGKTGLRNQVGFQGTSSIGKSLFSSSIGLGSKLFPIKPPEELVKRELILTLPLLDNQQIRIELKPEWSPGSIDYFHRLVEHQCASCSFYRIARHHGDEPGEGVVLGVMQNLKHVPLNKQKGICPEGSKRHYHDQYEEREDENEDEEGQEKEPARKYDDDNPRENCEDCECQGPILRRGMAAWVGGSPGGPEFFINLYEDAAKYEGSRHAVFGEVVDYQSFDVLAQVMDEDTSFGDSRVFDDQLHFYIDLE